MAHDTSDFPNSLSLLLESLHNSITQANVILTVSVRSFVRFAVHFAIRILSSMTSLTSFSRHSSDPHDRLGDESVGQVLSRVPRGQRQDHDVAETRALLRPFTAPRRSSDLYGSAFQSADTLLSLTAVASKNTSKAEKSLPHLREMTLPQAAADVHPTETSDTEAITTTTLKRKRSGLSRREQCRANQARYRNKQRNLQLHLEQSVGKLRRELDGLKQRRRDLTSRERISHSPWTIVAEAFHLLQTSFRSPWRLAQQDEIPKHADLRHSLAFLRESYVHDVSMGDVRGDQALVEQLRRYSLYFGDPQIKLDRIEEAAPGVMRATAHLSVTVTEFTVRHVFPHLDEHKSLREKLLGVRLSCRCSINFLFDEECGRVMRLESSIDWLSSLMRALRSTEDASVVCESALFTTGCVIGDIASAFEE